MNATDRNELERLREAWRARDWKAVKDFAAGRLEVLSVWLEAEGNAMLFVVREPDAPGHKSYMLFDPETFYQMARPEMRALIKKAVKTPITDERREQ